MIDALGGGGMGAEKFDAVSRRGRCRILDGVVVAFKLVCSEADLWTAGG